MDVQRFITKLGHVSSTVMEEVAAALAAIIEYE
jgi:mRNA-degrading endonuclease toxin of MazEF toxin-antitoxin module